MKVLRSAMTPLAAYLSIGRLLVRKISGTLPLMISVVSLVTPAL